MKIVLIRHSKTTLNKNIQNEQWILSEEGVSLAQDLSKNSIIKKCTVIYSSLQTKALETALILAKPNYIPIRTEQTLTETTSVTNGFFENFEEEISKWHQGDYRINNGETKSESLKRFKNTIEQIALRHSSDDFVGIVAHGNVLSILSECYYNKYSYDIHKKLQMPDFAILNSDTWKFERMWTELN